MSDAAAVAVPTSRSVAILGADAYLAVRPCTPEQLANACLAGGFAEVFPASWGDELVAAGCLERLERRSGSAIFCACPHVVERLAGAGELRTYTIPLISPPAAVARYLRALYPGAALEITYVGECPGAQDDLIDKQLSPRELIARLSERGVAIAAQSSELAAKAHDRRRFHSIPGGAPSAQRLAEQSTARTLVEVHDAAGLASLTGRAMSNGNALLDFAPLAGCVCAGAVSGGSVQDARGDVVALEPPRAESSIVDAAVRVRTSLPAAGDRDRTDVTWDDFLAALPATMAMHGEGATGPISRPASRAAPRRLRERTAKLPRAYLATRRGAPGPPHRDSLRTTAVSERSDEAQGSSAQRRSPRALPSVAAARGLARRDRWHLAGVMVAASLLGAMVTSALTVRVMERTRATPGASTGATSVASAGSTSSASSGDRPADSVVTVSAPPMAEPRDTIPVVIPPPATDSLPAVRAAHIDSAPRHEAVHLATPSPKRASPHAERRSIAVAEHARAAPPLRPSTPPASPKPSIAAARTAAVSPAPVETNIGSGAPAAAPPPAAPASNNAQVLEELRAIHAEIDARKRHVDSLTASLDSLKRVTPE
jgi:hypothetical protein